MNTGSVALFVCAGPATGFAQCALYRFIAAATHCTTVGGGQYLKTVRDMVNEPIARLRQRKRLIVKILYQLCLTGTCGVMVGTAALSLFLCYLNIQAEPAFVGWWLWWLINDYLSCSLAAGMSVTTYPSVVLLKVLDYRIDLSHLSQQITDLKASHLLMPEKSQETSGKVSHSGNWALTRASRSMNVDTLQDVMGTLSDVIRKAEHINRTCPPFLGIITLCALPIACSAMFVMTYAEGDVMLIGYTYVLIGSMFTLFAFSLQAIAGVVTADAQLIVRQLTGIACMQTRLPLQQRRRLLLLIEEVSSDRHPLAMKKTTGQPYSLIDFADYVIEVVKTMALIQVFSAFLIGVRI